MGEKVSQEQQNKHNEVKILVHDYDDVNFITSTSYSPQSGSASSSSSSSMVTSVQCPQEPCNLSIVFMGDSLTRFMYYSLAYYLRHNEWINPNSTPSLVKPADFIGGYELNFDWTPWFEASTLELQPFENCDCHREPGSIVRGMGRHTVIENRYFHDPERNNTVIYYQSFGTHIPIRGHWEDPIKAMKAPFSLQQQQQQGVQDQENKSQQYYNSSSSTIISYNNTTDNSTNILDATTVVPVVGPMRGRVDFNWSYDWPDAIIHQVATKIKPGVLVLNAGKWRAPGWGFEDEAYFNRFAKAVNSSNIPRVIWKTTTADRGGLTDPNLDVFDDKMCKQTWLECFNITSWTQKVPNKFYVDGGHFLEPVYRKMNELLFDHLGIVFEHETSRPTPLEWDALGIDDVTS